MLAILGIIYTALVCVPTVAILGSEKKYKRQKPTVFSREWWKPSGTVIVFTILVMIAMMSMIARMP